MEKNWRLGEVRENCEEGDLRIDNKKQPNFFTLEDLETNHK